VDRSGVRRSFLLALTLAAHAYLLLVSPAGAATIQVTTTGDENGSNPAACSLREAVQSANLNLAVGGCTAGDTAATDRITFASSTNASAILLSAGTLSTTSDLEIVGNGPTQTIVDGGGATQPFLVSGGASALIQDLAIVNGRAINGGAISNAGSLVVVNTAITGSSATLGGAILNSGGVLSVFSSTFSGNSATNGGALHPMGGGTVNLTSSTLSGNSATIGGAVYNDAGGAVSVTSSTLEPVMHSEPRGQRSGRA
jgi:CSLREA domain-containing protein